ncbi:MAG: DUF2868 domain-containing protein [Desulfobulbaceae bacterium]|nr:DUF2868 domain-containing protein [Desulfobulbaceae bacterium]
MKTSLQYKDIIDLEYFFNQDRDLGPEELHKRDRQISLQFEQDCKESEPTPIAQVKDWLQQRRSTQFSTPQQKSPGGIFYDAFRAGSIVVALKGLLVGIIAGLAFFTYSGTTPVNVFQFLLLFVGSQFLFILVLLFCFLVKVLRPEIRLPSPYSFFYLALIKKLATLVHKQWFHGLSAEKRSGFSHAFGIFRANNTTYGSLFYWPFFNLAQLFGVSFNIGLLATTLVKVATTDLAFGWQSTIQFSNFAILRMVETLSLPWAWLFENGGHPSLAEIEGSRIILKDGIYHLVTSDLIAWWPFLTMCLLCYGLLIRLLLLSIGSLIERQQLQAFSPDTPAYIGLIRRMSTPIVTTQAIAEAGQEKIEAKVLQEHKQESQVKSQLSPQLVLIPDDIFSACTVDDLRPLLKLQGLSPYTTQRFLAGYEDDQELLQTLASQPWQKGQGLFIVMEGWMVPLVDFLSYLKNLRELLPAKTIISLALIGRPGSTIFTPLQDNELRIWRQKVEAVGDPHLHVFPLIKF